MRIATGVTTVLAFGIVAAIFGAALYDIARLTILTSDRKPYPAVLRQGGDERRGLIGVVCWPGWDNGRENDVCPSFFDGTLAPEDPLIVERDTSVSLDFSRTGAPNSVNVSAIHVPDDRVRPIDGTIGWNQPPGERAHQIARWLAQTSDVGQRTITIDLPSGTYILHVNATLDLSGHGYPYYADYTRFFHIRVADESQANPLLESHSGICT